MNEMPPLRSVRELPTEIMPARDLWPAIAAAIELPVAPPVQPYASWQRSRTYYGIAAAVALVALGAWLGRSLLPGAPIGAAMPAQVASISPTATPGLGAFTETVSPVVMTASLTLDPAARDARQRRLAELGKQLAALPPESQRKVTASLDAIEQAVHDIQSALGRDPGNLLLQQLLVSSFQQEMRVLGAVDEANRMSKGTGL